MKGEILSEVKKLAGRFNHEIDLEPYQAIIDCLAAEYEETNSELGKHIKK